MTTLATPNYLAKWGLRPPSERWAAGGWKPAGEYMGSELWVRDDQLTAQLSAGLEEDGHRWLHLQVSHVSRTPTHEEVSEASAAFIGNRVAFTVHPFDLHVWAPIGHYPLPRFGHAQHYLSGSPTPQTLRAGP